MGLRTKIDGFFRVLEDEGAWTVPGGFVLDPATELKIAEMYREAEAATGMSVSEWFLSRPLQSRDPTARFLGQASCRGERVMIPDESTPVPLPGTY